MIIIIYSYSIYNPYRPDERDEVEMARVSLLQNAKAARSDHLALVAAFNGWARAQAKGEISVAFLVGRSCQMGSVAVSSNTHLFAAFNGWARASTLLTVNQFRTTHPAGGRSEASAFATRFSLSESSLEAVAQGRGEYTATLEELGFLPYGCASNIRIQRGGGGSKSGELMLTLS